MGDLIRSLRKLGWCSAVAEWTAVFEFYSPCERRSDCT
jgi:hypothetical protein